MKRLFTVAVFILIGLTWISGISPYYKVASYTGPLKEAVGQVQTILEEGGCKVIGQYHPGNNPDLYVLVFTNDELQNLCRKAGDRGMLAAAIKVGFQKTGEAISTSIVNPEYLFYAYFQENMNDPSFKSAALDLSSRIIHIAGDGSNPVPFGGDLEADKLMKYRYMAGMPNFNKPVSLAEFDDFKEGLSAIRDGLSGSGNTLKVYEIVDEQYQTAVFGIGIKDKEKGEAHFLPIIGESHVAAMPYELILQGNEVTMLHGRFRFALHWPELKMKTFTKIMSSPGDVEDAMKGLFETD